MLNKFQRNPVTSTITSRTSISMNSFRKTCFLLQFQRAYLLRRRRTVWNEKWQTSGNQSQTSQLQETSHETKIEPYPYSRSEYTQKSFPFKIYVQTQTTWRSFIHPQHSRAMSCDDITWSLSDRDAQPDVQQGRTPRTENGKAKQGTNQWNK